MKRNEFFVYILWCFGLTWLCYGIIIANSYLGFFPEITNKIIGALGTFAPTFAVIVLLKKYGEVSERKNICQFIFDLPNRISTYIILLVFLLWRLLVFIICGDIKHAEPFYMVFPIFIMQLLFQGGFEEPGWRGFLQPYFDKKFNLFFSVILISVIWTIWHIPLWFIPDSAQSQMSFLIFFLQILVNSCSLATIIKLTKSVAFCMIYHAWCNTVFLIIPFNMNIGIVAAYSIEAIASLIVCLLYNKKMRTMA